MNDDAVVGNGFKSVSFQRVVSRGETGAHGACRSVRYGLSLALKVQQKRARKIRFHQNATIISGNNSTGKSQILKALYTCFGVLPAVRAGLIDTAALKLLPNFSVDGREYSMLRDAETYTLFGESENVLSSYRNVLGGLASTLARIFDFHLQFYTAADEPRVAHPRYLFAPFYIDQDHGYRTCAKTSRSPVFL